MIDFKSSIKSHYDTLSRSEKSIADFMTAQPLSASKMSIQEVSAATATSVATLSRFAKHIGYQSYQELKFSLAQVEKKQEILFETLTPDDSVLTVSQKVFSANIHSLEATKNFLKEKELNQALHFLTISEKTDFFGLGGSSIVAVDAFHKFLRTPLNCDYQSDFHMQLMAATKLTKKDCAVVISHTGNNQDTLRIVDILRSNEVPIIVITSHAGSELARLATVSFISISEETSYRSEALSSVLSQLSIIDSLYVCYSVSHNQDTTKTADKIRETIQSTRLKK